MNLKFNVFVALAFLLCFSWNSCTKEKVEPTFSIDTKNQYEYSQISSVKERSAESCLQPYQEIFSRHLKHYKGTDPSIYFPQNVYTAINQKLELEIQKQRELGFSNYLKELSLQRKISVEAEALMAHLYESVEQDVRFDQSGFQNNLTSQFDPIAQGINDPFYCFVYSIALDIYNDYYLNSDALSTREDCKFKSFVQHILQTAGAGAALGGTIGKLISGLSGGDDTLFVIKAFGIVVQVGGSAIGGAIGAIIGLFTSKHREDPCGDCHIIERISISKDDNCDLTRGLAALGAGEDALAFEWHVEQAGLEQIITTAEPFLTITQSSISIPLEISVATLCMPEGSDNPNDAVLTEFSETAIIDLAIDQDNPLGQPGDLTINYNCLPEQSSCFSLEEPTFFFWSSSNAASGHITYDFRIEPPGLAEYQYFPGSNQVLVYWKETGTGYVKIRARNTCTGLYNQEYVDIVVE